MIRFYIEPGYNVKYPEREYGNAGVDFRIPEYSDDFVKAFSDKNLAENAVLCINECINGESTRSDFIRIAPHGRANIPSGVRSRISPNIALEAQNKSGIATKTGLVYGAATIDSNYQGIIHISVINTTAETVTLPLGMKIMQFIPRIIDTDTIEVFTDISLDEFYKDFEFTNRGEGAFGSTGL
jgi:dUTP pyrophosphatase